MSRCTCGRRERDRDSSAPPDVNFELIPIPTAAEGGNVPVPRAIELGRRWRSFVVSRIPAKALEIPLRIHFGRSDPGVRLWHQGQRVYVRDWVDGDLTPDRTIYWSGGNMAGFTEDVELFASDTIDLELDPVATGGPTYAALDVTSIPPIGDQVQTINGDLLGVGVGVRRRDALEALTVGSAIDDINTSIPHTGSATLVAAPGVGRWNRIYRFQFTRWPAAGLYQVGDTGLAAPFLQVHLPDPAVAPQPVTVIDFPHGFGLGNNAIRVYNNSGTAGIVICHVQHSEQAANS